MARERGIPLLQPAKASEPWFGDALRELDVDAAVIVAWGCLIPQRLLAVPRFGWVNLHYSLLPAWRGAAPVQRAIMAGETTTGVTTMRLVRELDAGPVWRQQSVAIGDDETAGELMNRLSAIGAETLVDTMPDVEAGVEPTPQPTEGVRLAPKVTPDDARIDWTQPATRVRALVRGVTPAPGAWTMLGDARLKVVSVDFAGEDGLAPGELAASKHFVLVGTGDAALKLVTVQAVGKPVMSAADWARGARLDAGVRLA